VEFKTKISQLKKLFKMGMRGQLSVVNLIGLFVIIVLFTTLADPLVFFIGTAQNSTGGTTDTILSLILPLMAVGIILSIFTFQRPTFEREV